MNRNEKNSTISKRPILLIGGSGQAGYWTARQLRTAHPEMPLLIAGRDLGKAQKVAAEIGNAEGITINLALTDLGLGKREVSAVAIFFTDDKVAGLGFAQARGVPYIGISPGIHEIGPEIAAYISRPNASSVVLGTEWLVGATSIPSLEFAKKFSMLEDITIGALIDEQDAGGPAADADLERQTKIMPLTLTRRDGSYVWRVGEDAKAKFHAVDGRLLDATALSPHDVIALATETGAPNVQFNMAMGVSSTRLAGQPLSTEIIIELRGEDQTGTPLHTRHAVVHPQGQMPLTGLGVAMVLERLTGLDGKPAPKAGLYFPYQLLDSGSYFYRLEKSGGVIMQLKEL